MSAIFKAIRKVIPFKKPKGLVGYDLQGNKYFEINHPMGGRRKRYVEYSVDRDVSEYIRADLKPPVQWEAWLAHTRTHPPSLQELEHDHQRQVSLLPRVAAIEAREREERIRQGYLLPDGSEPIKVKELAGPSVSGERKAQAEKFIKPLESPRPISVPTSQQVDQNHKPVSTFYDDPTPRKKVNQNASAKELRRLAEEELKSQIAEGRATSTTGKEDIQPVQIGHGGLQPRRRPKEKPINP
ncbi:hypothetical protein L204_102182 [Cryptococcus depauperatus]